MSIVHLHPENQRRPAAPEPRLPDSLFVWTGFRLHTVSRLTEERFARALRPLGIGPGHYGVLALLAERGSVTLEAIPGQVQADPSEVMTVVGELRDRGLLENDPRPRQRRSFALRLTSAGRQLLHAAARVTATADDVILAPLSPRERIEFREMLGRLTRHELDVRLVAQAMALPAGPAHLPAQLDALTERETGVLRLLQLGKSNQQIADTFGISLSTVKTHVSHILSKLGLQTRLEIAGSSLADGPYVA